MRQKIVFVMAVVLVVSAFVSGGAWAYTEEDVSGGGTISGTITFAGSPPAPMKLEITKDEKVCGKEAKFNEGLVVSSSKGIMNAVVSLTDIKKGKKLALLDATEAVDQRGCQFRPHVSLTPAGSKLKILNNDGLLHNFHTHGTKNPSTNKAMPKFKKKMNVKFAEPEVVKITCDAHSWMNGWVVVAEHPYYSVTDDKGAFTLSDVPPGTYQLQVWHETLGTMTKQVDVKSGADTKVDVALGK